jgi:hypothetical protein
MITADEARAVALGFPEVVEVDHHGRPPPRPAAGSSRRCGFILKLILERCVLELFLFLFDCLVLCIVLGFLQFACVYILLFFYFIF